MMRIPCGSFRYLVLALLIVVCATAVRAAVARAEGAAVVLPPLQRYEAELTTSELERLAREGYDVTHAPSAHPGPDGRLAVDLVLTPSERAELEARGLTLTRWRSPDGLTEVELAARQQQDPEVFRPFDGDGNLRDELYGMAAEHPSLVDLQVIGESVESREVIALRVTSDPTDVPDGSRPAVLYLSLLHGREWIGGEVNRRLLQHVVDGYGQDEEITALLDTTELWFVLVANPDGYQLTWTPEHRLWHRNVRDNDGDGVITRDDGVHLNRNFDAHWGYDIEGSDGRPFARAYRGPTAASEPETQALQSLLDRVGFEFAVSWGAWGRILFHGLSWQSQTPLADQPTIDALTGTRLEPAIPAFFPMPISRFYLINGQMCDYAFQTADTTCWTVLLSQGYQNYGYYYPDDEALIQAEFEYALPFALDLGRSAERPTQPSSHLDRTPPQIEPMPFDVSYGSPQPVQARAARHLGPVTVRYRINNGAEQEGPTEEWSGGARYGGDGNRHYRFVRGEVRGAERGDTVRVWFEGGGEESSAFTYRMISDSDASALVVAAEDYTGILPVYEDFEDIEDPLYDEYYLEALEANGLTADVYDIDANGRQAPDPLGVLGHYELVIWYTGDDIITREQGMDPGTASQAANDLALAVRAYLNEGGKVLYSGKYAGYQYTQELEFDPVGDQPCSPADATDGCAELRDDVQQYWLGLFDVVGDASPPVDVSNLAGAGTGMWSGAGNDLDVTMWARFDFGNAADDLFMEVDSWWSMEDGFDYGYVMASTDGGQTWVSRPDRDGFFEGAPHPDGEDRPEWGLTGKGDASGITPLHFDLPDLVGQEQVDIMFRMRSDEINPSQGWIIDNIKLEDGLSGLRYQQDFATGFEEWTIEGWQAIPAGGEGRYEPPSVTGRSAPFDNLAWSMGAPSAENQDYSESFLPTSSVMPPETHPQFRSWNAALFDDPQRGPHSGQRYLSSGRTSHSYQRLTRTVDVPASGDAELSMWLTYDVDPDRDAIFVEARTAGGDDWTTLSDLNGHTAPDTALNCIDPYWYEVHPQLAHYLTPVVQEGACQGQGTTGEWHAATGRSPGWVEWTVDLSDWAGQQVEVSLAYVSGETPSLGMFVDDVTLPDGTSTSFEDDLGGWTTAGAPPGSPDNARELEPATLADFPSGTVVVTEDTIAFGFGLEGVAGAEDRAALMGAAIDHLLPDGPTVPTPTPDPGGGPSPTPRPTPRPTPDIDIADTIYLPQARKE